ncbi:MAG: hypothetical protein IH950_13975 [Bacteroidetes bacterium]|nr:hypothetical protein [Bacteroidota bacterium]
MNSKQFVSSVICYFFEKYTILKKVFGGLSNFLYPNFERLPIFKIFKSSLKNHSTLGIFLFLFLFLFVIQGYWSFLNDRFFPDNLSNTKNFLEDWVDLLNYSIICEAYVILGIIFLTQKYSIYDSLKESGFLSKTFETIPYKSNGFVGISLVLFVATFSSIGYTFEVNTYSDFYWFMSTPPPNVTFGPNGYYYLFMNQLLLLFIIFVGLNHLGLFHISSVIVKEIEGDVNKISESEAREKWTNENLLKSRMQPFSQLILVSKAFVLVITINLLLWKYNQPDIKQMYELSVLVTAIFGIWIFALPRYYIQYRIFKVWSKLGKHEYKDLRMPWIIGFSAVIDVILLTILIKTLLGDAVANLFNQLFS